MNQLKITYSRSSGPGGQNVNCVDTKVDIRFHVTSADWLSDETKKLFLEQVRFACDAMILSKQIRAFCGSRMSYVNRFEK